METEYSTFQICEAFDIPHERLRQWLKKGFVRPKVPAEGQGTRAVFDLQDVYGILIFKTLLEIGFKREVAGEFFSFIQKDRKITRASSIVIGVPFRGGRPVAPGNRVFVFDNLETVFGSIGHNIDDWSHFHLINLSKIRKTVESVL